MTPLRRRLLVLSAPVVLVLVAGAAWLVWTGLAERAALQQFAAGVTAAREDRLYDAEDDFGAALRGIEHDESCSVRVDLVLVQETLGDRAVAVVDADEARGHYRDAREVVAQAPAGCFTDNTDPDAQRQAVRADTPARLDAKIAALSQPLPPAPPPPPPVAVAPPPVVGGAPAPSEQERRLNPEQGDPLDRLGDILRDAAQG